MRFSALPARESEDLEKAFGVTESLLKNLAFLSVLEILWWNQASELADNKPFLALVK